MSGIKRISENADLSTNKRRPQPNEISFHGSIGSVDTRIKASLNADSAALLSVNPIRNCEIEQNVKNSENAAEVTILRAEECRSEGFSITSEKLLDKRSIVGNKFTEASENGCFGEDEQEEKREEKRRRVKKKMFAILMSYSGKSYLGLQHNPGFHTIEGELLKVLQQVDLLSSWEAGKLQSINFQRAARTDKGVSAAKQVISVKLPIADGEEDHFVTALNAKLPQQIRIMALLRTTRSFNSKNWCNYRTYSYLTPSFAFAPTLQATNNNFRISKEELSALRKLLQTYCGTHNFHNFTVRKKPTDASAKRHILSTEVMDPQEREGVEWLRIKIKGQSFMMHQIRKMLGLAIAVQRGVAPPSVLLRAMSQEKVCTPKAPGLGLVLEQPHFDVYNDKFGQDGTRESVDWTKLEDKVEKFRREFIEKDIVETELSERSMMAFIDTLHTFGINEKSKEADGDDSDDDQSDSDLNKDVSKLSKLEHCKRQKNHSTENVSIHVDEIETGCAQKEDISLNTEVDLNEDRYIRSSDESRLGVLAVQNSSEDRNDTL